MWMNHTQPQQPGTSPPADHQPALTLWLDDITSFTVFVAGVVVVVALEQTACPRRSRRSSVGLSSGLQAGLSILYTPKLWRSDESCSVGINVFIPEDKVQSQTVTR